MLTIANGKKVYLSLETVDFRKQIGGLKKWVQNQMMQNPFSGAYFFFLSKNRKTIKVIHFDGQGMCLYTKKLSQGKFAKWNGLYDLSINHVIMPGTAGQVMLMNGDPAMVKIPKNWKEIS